MPCSFWLRPGMRMRRGLCDIHYKRLKRLGIFESFALPSSVKKVKTFAVPSPPKKKDPYYAIDYTVTDRKECWIKEDYVKCDRHAPYRNLCRKHRDIFIKNGVYEKFANPIKYPGKPKPPKPIKKDPVYKINTRIKTAKKCWIIEDGVRCKNKNYYSRNVCCMHHKRFKKNGTWEQFANFTRRPKGPPKPVYNEILERVGARSMKEYHKIKTIEFAPPPYQENECKVIESGVRCRNPLRNKANHLCNAHYLHLQRHLPHLLKRTRNAPRHFERKPGPLVKGVCQVIDDGVPCETPGLLLKGKTMCHRHWRYFKRRGELDVWKNQD